MLAFGIRARISGGVMRARANVVIMHLELAVWQGYLVSCILSLLINYYLLFL